MQFPGSCRVLLIPTFREAISLLLFSMKGINVREISEAAPKSAERSRVCTLLWQSLSTRGSDKFFSELPEKIFKAKRRFLPLKVPFSFSSRQINAEGDLRLRYRAPGVFLTRRRATSREFRLRARSICTRTSSRFIIPEKFITSEKSASARR